MCYATRQRCSVVPAPKFIIMIMIIIIIIIIASATAGDKECVVDLLR